MTLRYEEIAEILKIIGNSNCDEVVIETGDVKLVVRRNGAAAAAPAPTAPDNPPALSPLGAGTAPPAPKPATTAGARATAANQFEVTAPMLGTFYRAPSPEAPPFVEIGSTVRKGQALCLIEVMKLFTTIHAERDGRVVEIGAKNGELVEYGRALFVLEAT